MNKIFLLALIFLTSFSATAQSKIKGNRKVETQERSFDYFSKLEVYDKVKLNVKQSNRNALELEADENLHTILDTDVKNSVLVISLNKRIASSKRFNITLYVEDLDQIILNDDSEVKFLEELDVFNLELILNNKSELEMDNLKTKFLSLKTSERAKSEIRVRTDSLVINAEESSRIKLDVIAESTTIDYSGGATVEAEGRTTSLELNATKNAAFKGAEFVADHALVNALEKSDTYVNCRETIVIEAKNKAKVYLFGKPEINLKVFEDNASLLKRESMKLLE